MIFVVSGSTKFLAFEFNGIDFSIFDWMLHNSTQGSFMWSPFCDCNHFGVHPTWLLSTLVPLHYAWPSPWLLVFTHALSLALCLPQVVKLARLCIRDIGDLELVLIASAFSVSQAMGSVANYGFHPEVWYVPLGLWFLTEWLQSRKTWILAALLYAAVKEDGALYLAAWGAGSLALKDYRRKALTLILVSAMFFVFNTKILQPLAWPSSDFKPSWLVFWAKYGNSVPEIITGVTAHPLIALHDVASSGIWQWLLPFAFAPLLSAQSLMGMAPGVIMLGLANTAVLRGYGVYYAAPLIPFALLGWLRLLKKLQKNLDSTKFTRALVLLTLLLGFVGGVGPRIGRFKPGIEAALAKWQSAFLLKPDAPATCVQTALYPHIGYLKNIKPLTHNNSCGPGSVFHSALDPYPFSSKTELMEVAEKNQWLDLAKS